jgi:hypothetical protein
LLVYFLSPSGIHSSCTHFEARFAFPTSILAAVQLLDFIQSNFHNPAGRVRMLSEHVNVLPAANLNLLEDLILVLAAPTFRKSPDANSHFVKNLFQL